MSDEKISEVNKPKKKKGMKAISNFLIIIVVIVLIAMFAWAEMDRRSTKQELQEAASQLEELKRSSEATLEEKEGLILDKVSELVELPIEPKPVVLTIVDAESISEENQFYRDAENGDHVIITDTWAVLYSISKEKIISASSVSPEEAQATREQQENQQEGGEQENPDENNGEEGNVNDEGTGEEVDEGENAPDPDQETFGF